MGAFKRIGPPVAAEPGDAPLASVTAEPTAEPTAVKLRGRPFEKGVSGNPGGQPKKGRELVSEKVRRKSRDGGKMIDALLRIVDDPRATNADKIAASKALLDRGYGAATQVSEVHVTDETRERLEREKEFGAMSPEELQRSFALARVMSEAAQKFELEWSQRMAAQLPPSQAVIDAVPEERAT